MKKIGEFLKAKRKEKEFSLRDLEKIAGVTNPHIRNIEEEIRKPTFAVLMKLIDALNVEPQEFLIETGYMRPGISEGKTKSGFLHPKKQQERIWSNLSFQKIPKTCSGWIIQ